MSEEKFNMAIGGLDYVRPVLLAVSGGIDSICMAGLFSHTGHPFAVAHCNFHLRGAESDADALFVETWCKSHDVPFHRADFDTMKYARENGLSVEMAARELRYDWFARLCVERGYAALAVAHNANDNAETLMLNLLRGTGLRGVCGMKPVGTLPLSQSMRQRCPELDIPLIRPMLGFSRDEIEKYAQTEKLSHREDRTNAETLYKRNKLRHNVFPIFSQINPSFLTTLSEDMAHFSQVADVVDDYYSDFKAQCCRRKGLDLRVNVAEFMSRRHWKYLLYRLMDEYGFNSDAVSSLTEVLEKGLSGKTFLSQGYRLVTSSEELVILAKTSESHGSGVRLVSPVLRGRNEVETLVLRGEGLYSFSGQDFLLEISDWKSGMALRTPPGVIQWDADKYSMPALARHWMPGDWICPLGLRGRKKLSDLFTDLKLSLVDKERIIVFLAHDDPHRVLAIPGLRIDESIRISADTKRICKLTLQ